MFKQLPIMVFTAIAAVSLSGFVSTPTAIQASTSTASSINVAEDTPTVFVNDRTMYLEEADNDKHGVWMKVRETHQRNWLDILNGATDPVTEQVPESAKNDPALVERIYRQAVDTCNASKTVGITVSDPTAGGLIVVVPEAARINSIAGYTESQGYAYLLKHYESFGPCGLAATAESTLDEYGTLFARIQLREITPSIVQFEYMDIELTQLVRYETAGTVIRSTSRISSDGSETAVSIFTEGVSEEHYARYAMLVSIG